MDWILEAVVIWIGISIVLIATIWYGGTTLSQLWPDWWRRTVIDSVESYPTATDESEYSDQAQDESEYGDLLGWAP